jgi:hypothetical protein
MSTDNEPSDELKFYAKRLYREQEYQTADNPYIAEQLRKEKFRERRLSELQVGMVLGKLEARGFDIANTRLIHKRLAKLPAIAQEDFLKSAFHYKFQYVSKIPARDFKFLEDCMDWKTLWERVNYLYGCECVELPITGKEDRPYYGFFVGQKTTAPIGLTPENIREMDISNGWMTRDKLDWTLANEESIELTIHLRGWKLEQVLKYKDYKGLKTVLEAYEGFMMSKNTRADWRNDQI